MRLRLEWVAAAVLVVAGCGSAMPAPSTAGGSEPAVAPSPPPSRSASTPTPRPSRTLAADEYWLPSYPVPANGPGETVMACAGVGLFVPGDSAPGIPLNGSRSDPRYVWLGTGAARRDLIWSPGYSVRFTGDSFEILDETGAVRHRSGDRIDGGCVTGDDHVLWLPDW